MNRRRVGAASVDGVAEDRRPRCLVLSVNLSQNPRAFSISMSARRPVRAGRGGRVTGLHTVEAVSGGGFGPSKRGSCFQYIYLVGSIGRSAAIALKLGSGNVDQVLCCRVGGSRA